METKYLLFITAALNIIPGTALLVMFRGLQRYAMLGLVLPVLLFNQTSINFFSHEIYRGTSRGMEVSVIYLIALTIIFALTVTNGFKSPFPDWGSRLYLLYFILGLPSFFNAENSLFAFFEVWKMLMIYLVFIAVFYYLYYYHDFEIFMYGFAVIVLINFSNYKWKNYTLPLPYGDWVVKFNSSWKGYSSDFSELELPYVNAGMQITLPPHLVLIMTKRQ